MLFDAKLFEQFFNERSLKQGIKLFDKKDVVPVERPSLLEYRFLVDATEITIKKRGDKILSYQCGCANKSYCEHLAACLFYFQEHLLALPFKKNKKVSVKIKAAKLPKRSRQEEAIHKLEYKALSHFIHSHGDKLYKENIADFFSDKSSVTAFELYALQIRTILETYSSLTIMDQAQVDELYQKIKFLHKATAKIKTKIKALYFLDLAIISELPDIYKLRFQGDETKLKVLHQQALSELDGFFNEGLQKTEQEAWYRATLESLKNNWRLNSEAFVFLIPRLAAFTRNKMELEMIRILLEKRKFKSHFSQRLDKLLMARLQIALREWELFKVPFGFKYYDSTVELSLAEADLLFCKHKTDKAFLLLEQHYERVRSQQHWYYFEYLSYVIQKARQYHKKEIELKYLNESFIYGIAILPDHLERFISLLSEEELNTAVDELLKRLRVNRVNYAFDKIASLLFRLKRWEELISELKRQQNKFSLLQEVLLKIQPNNTEALLNLYAKQLLDALTHASAYQLQQQLADHAKLFIDTLPESSKENLLTKILNSLGGQSRIHRYVITLFEMEE